MRNKHVTEELLTGGIVISMFLWGLSWPSGKVLTHYSTAVNFAVYRYIIVAIALLILLIAFRVSLPVKKAGIPSIIASGVLLSIYSYFFFKGLKAGNAGAGGVLVTTMNPIMAYTIGIVLSRRAPSRNEAIGLVLGLAGGCILLKVWDNAGAIFDSGNIYFLLAAFIWAAMSKITSRGALYGSSMGFTFWQYVVTLGCLLPLVNMQEFRAVFSVKDPVFWGNLFFSSVIVTALATTVYFYSTTRLGAERASSYVFMVPLAASVSSWLLLDERILPHTAIGGVVGMVAVYIINRKRRVRNVVVKAEKTTW